MFKKKRIKNGQNGQKSTFLKKFLQKNAFKIF